MRRELALLGAAAVLAGCGAGRTAPAKQRRAGVATTLRIPASLRSGLRPIGRGPRFQPPIRGLVPGRCESVLGARDAAHIEVFGGNRVVLIAAGVGTGPPRELTEGRVREARCFGAVVTLDPTGIVYFRAGSRLTLGTVFSAWGEPLTATRVASFSGRTAVYVGGRLWRRAPTAVPLRAGAEIVVESGPYVPPHRRFVFPQQPSSRLR
jgi:hypothetical protein